MSLLSSPPAPRRLPAAVGLLLLLGLVPVLSGDPPPASQAPTFPAETNLVQVDAVVLDSKGEPVEGLRADDFVVKEEGSVQAVRHFEAVALPQSAPSRSATAQFVSTNTRPAGVPRARSFVIVFDDAQLSRPTGELAREAVARFLRTGLRDDDEVTLVSTATGLWWSARLGEGREDLLALLDRLQGKRTVDTSGSFMSDFEAMRIYVNRDRQLGAEVTRRFAENGVIVDPGNANALQAANDLQLGEGHPLVRAKAAEVYMNERLRNQATLRTLERVAQALGQGKGRKSVLLVSDGFIHDPSLAEFRDVLRAMNGANASVYFLDARGLTGSSEFASAEFGRALLEQDVSSTLSRVPLETQGAESVALDTGGFSVRNPNDLEGGMQRVARESRSYYLLGYVSTNPQRDGKFRKIEVAVRRPGVKVRARSGYYATSDAASAPTGPGELDPRVREGLDSPFLADGIPLRMAAYVFGPAADAGKVSVLLVAEADPDGIVPASEGPLEATLDSYLVVAGRDGFRHPVEKQISLSVPASARARVRQTWLPIFRDLELPPGAYQARLLLRDQKTGRVGTVRHEFKVPGSESLRTSTPILTDSLQGDGKQAPRRPVPLARRSFPSGADLLYVFEVYGLGPVLEVTTVTSECEVRRADGSPMVKSEASPIQPDPQGHLGRQIPISLRGAPAGDYEVVLTVKDRATGQQLRLTDPFTVSAPAASPSARLP